MLTAHKTPARLGWSGLILALVVAWSLSFVSTSPAADVQPSFPIRAAFYYPWYPEAWNQNNIYPYTNYTPSLGYYDLSNSAVLQQHLAAMQHRKPSSITTLRFLCLSSVALLGTACGGHSDFADVAGTEEPVAHGHQLLAAHRITLAFDGEIFVDVPIWEW